MIYPQSNLKIYHVHFWKEEYNLHATALCLGVEGEDGGEEWRVWVEVGGRGGWGWEEEARGVVGWSRTLWRKSER